MLGTFDVILLDSTLEHNNSDSCVWYTIYKNCVNNTSFDNCMLYDENDSKYQD
jgi:hypothetical protein